MTYRDDGDVFARPMIDPAFDAARVSAIGALAGEAFNAARECFDGAIAALREDPPNTRGAVRSCFDAADKLFKLLTGTDQDLTPHQVTATLKPVVDQLHGRFNAATKWQADRMLSSFAHWIDAAEPYRQGGGAEAAAPTHVLAVAYVHTGAGFIRWMAHMVMMRRL